MLHETTGGRTQEQLCLIIGGTLRKEESEHESAANCPFRVSWNKLQKMKAPTPTPRTSFDGHTPLNLPLPIWTITTLPPDALQRGPVGTPHGQ